jgi:hypothetical protein
LPLTVAHPTLGDLPGFGHTWPNYGFDETFLQRVFYPFFLSRGVYTVFTCSQSAVLFPLDVYIASRAHAGARLAHGLR